MKHLFVTTVIWIFITQYVLGQSVPKFQTVVPVSPTAAALQKFSDYPVDLHNGLVDISIPIHTIEINGIKVPIQLKYHAAGIKYDDNCQGLGIGWTLIAGGMVSGTIQGIQDNFTNTGTNYFKNAGEVNPRANCGTSAGNDPNGENSTLMLFDRGTLDSEYDQYSFSYPGGSGRFFFPGTTAPVIIPFQNLKITRSGPGVISSKSIVDENGVTFNFGSYTDKTKSGAYELSFEDQRSGNVLLTEIISADKADTVIFNYTIYESNPSSGGPQSKLVINDQVEIRDRYNIDATQPTTNLDPRRQVNANNYIMNFSFSQLTSITFRGGKVLFGYGSNLRLNNVNIYNSKSLRPVKTVTLQQSDFGNDYYKLDQVNFSDTRLTQTYSYKMGYTGTPYNKLKTGIDYWGFHNGAPFVNDYVPNFQVTTDAGTSDAATYTVGSMDRTANENGMLQGMLNKITYPTGGWSIFNLEANRYSGGQIAGGLRIKKIDNYDVNGNYLNSKWYKYGQTENGDGTLYRAIDPADYCYNVWDIYTKGVYTQYSGFSSTGTPAYVCNERSYGAFPKFSNTWNGSPVVYDYVTEYSGDGTNANGKTVYQFENIPDLVTTYNFFARMPILRNSYNWKTGKLLSKQSFNNTGGAYNLIYSLSNQYQDFNYRDYHCLKIIPSVNWHDDGMSLNDKWFGLECFSSTPPSVISNSWLNGTRLVSVHAYADYYLSTGSRELVSSVETKDGVTLTTQYTYDANYLKPINTATAKSNGTTKLVTYTYPFSYTNVPYTQMVAANMISPVISTSEYNNDLSNFLQSSTTEYKSWSNNLFAPVSISTKVGNNAQEPRLYFDSYDSYGNIRERHKAAGTSEVFLWGYNAQYPVASVQNASYQDLVNVLGQQTVDLLAGANPGTDTQVRSMLMPLYTDPRLKNAQVTTYTYDPLIGMTSMTDAKGYTTYYEYDGLQRLINVKDQNGNILKHTDYHYQRQ